VSDSSSTLLQHEPGVLSAEAPITHNDQIVNYRNPGTRWLSNIVRKCLTIMLSESSLLRLDGAAICPFVTPRIAEPAQVRFVEGAPWEGGF
jgi:hypothetical protein